ncbi:MAG: tyrosine-type recombinase/integrase [Thermocladium sp.]
MITLDSFINIIAGSRRRCSSQPRVPCFLTLTLGVTGARLGEVVGSAVDGVRVRDFDLEHYPPSVMIATEKVRGHPVRIIPLPEWFVPILRNFIIWHGVTDKLFNISPVQAWRLVRREAGVTPRDLRHGFAMYALKRGINPEEVRRMMGHRGMKMTFYYMEAVGLSPQDLRSPFTE